MVISCNSPYQQGNDTSTTPDTIVLKYGDQHENGTGLLNHPIWIYNPKTNESFTRFYEDSAYLVGIKYKTPVGIKLSPLTSNFEVDFQDSIAYVKTLKASDNWAESKVRFGFIVDTSKNIVIVHSRWTNPEDSTGIIETMTREDTLGYVEYQLHSKSRL